MDLFQADDKAKWLAAVDDYSGDLRACRFSNPPTGKAVIDAYAQLFASTSVPAVLKCDGEGILASREVGDWLTLMGTFRSLSSPGYPQSNGRAESGVKAAKKIINGCIASGAKGNVLTAEITRGFVAHRNALRYGVTSPAELLYGGRVDDGIVTSTDLGVEAPKRRVSNEAVLDRKERIEKSLYRNARHHDEELSVGDNVVAQNELGKKYVRSGVVEEVTEHDYRLLDDDTNKSVRRNRRMVRASFDGQSTASPSVQSGESVQPPVQIPVDTAPVMQPC